MYIQIFELINYFSTFKWLKKNLKKRKSGLNGKRTADLCDDRERNRYNALLYTC